MALKTLVKVGSITNLSDARYCAGMGVDLLGFNVVEGHGKYIGPKAFQEIRGWVTGPKIVAQVYGLRSAGDLSAIMEQYVPDMLECSLSELPLLTDSKLPIILSLSGGDTVPSNTTIAYQEIKSGVQSNNTSIPCLVNVASTDEVSKALQTNNVAGIALVGGSEIKPGLKQYDELADILELLETD